MARYLFKVSYTSEGLQGLLKEGGSGRRQMVQDLLAGLGGELEALYYAFGEDDVYLIAQLPDQETAAAISLVTGAAGAARIETTVLLEPEEIDRATKKSVPYRPPGA